MEEKKERFYDIDLLRFIAAISVVLFHYTYHGYLDGKSVLFFSEFAFLTKYGYLGVNIFFMISGFVILMSTYSSSPRKFIISRFIRLYPTFWIAILLTSLVGYMIGSDRYQVTFSQILVNFTMIPNVFHVKYIDGVYWTLFIELKFYLLVLFIMTLKLMKHIKIIALIWILWSIFYFYTSYPLKLHGILFPQYSSYFIAGAMFYLIRLEGMSYQKNIIVLLSYLSSILYALKHLDKQIERFDINLSSEVVILLITLFYFIMYSIATKKYPIFNQKIFYLFGILTYPLYLIHQHIGYMLFSYFENDIDKYSLLLIVIFTMLFLSYLIHIIIETLNSKFRSLQSKVVGQQ